MNLQVVNFQRCEKVPVCQLLYCTPILIKVQYYKSKNAFLILCVSYVHISVRSIINLLWYSTI